MKTRLMRYGAAIAAVGLIAAACSDDDNGDSSSDTEPTEQTDPSAEEMSPGTIVEVATEAGDFTTLLAAVEAAGLVETLEGDGPFTVFAPTDAAFDALPEGTVEALLEDPTGDLADILTYHVVSGEVLAADVASLDGQAVTTVNGATFTVNVGDDGVTLTDGAGNTVMVVTTDIMASNGVIHVIDAVLLPA